MLSVSYASSWYTTPSALFWATFGLVLIGIATLAVTAVAWRSSLVKRRLLCSIVSCTRLLAAPEPVRGELEVRFDGQPVNDPYVVTLEIANVGRASIPSDLFDKGRSLVFGLSAPVLKILTVEHEPSSIPAPVFLAINDKWEMKPELVAKGELIRLSFLAAGPVKGLEVTENPLTDVSVQVRDLQTWLAQRTRRRNLLQNAVAICTGIFLSLVGIILGYNFGGMHARANLPAPAPASNFATVIACHNLRGTIERSYSASVSGVT